MFRNQLALGLKGMISKISENKDTSRDNSNSSTNSINNTPHRERSSSVSSQSLKASNTSDQLLLEDNNYSNDGQEVEGFLCPLCLRAFPSPESLSEHYSSEHSDFSTSNAFQCSECKMKFGSEEELISHHKRHHSNLVSADEVIRREFSKISEVIESEELELLRGQINALEEAKQLITNECQTLREQLKRSNEEKRQIENELSQLRCTTDDSEILKKELVKVQKLMNDMSVEREKEKELLTLEIKKQMESVVNERQTMNKELEELKQKHKQSIDDLLDMRSNKEKLEVELNLLRNEGLTVSSLRDDIENKCSIIGKLEQSVDILTKQLETVKTQLTETQQERDRFKDEAATSRQLENEVIQLKQSADKATKENIELNVIVSQLKSQLESLSSKHESLVIKMKVHEEMKAAGDQLDSKLSQEVELLKIDLMTAKQNLETSTISCKKFSEELDQVKKLNRTLKADNEQLVKEISRLNDEMNLEKNEAQSTSEKLSKQISFLENQIKLTQNVLDNCRISEKQFISKYNEEKDKLKQVSNQLISKETNLNEMIKANEKYQIEVNKLEGIVKDLNKQVQSEQDELEKTEFENQNLKEKINEIEGKLSFAENEKNLLNEELLKLSKAMKEKQSEHEKDLAGKNEEIENLTKRVTDYNRVLNLNDSLSMKVNELESRLEGLSSELNQKLQLVDSQLKNISDLNEKLVLYENQIKTYLTEIDSLKNERIKLDELLQNSDSKLMRVNEDYAEKCAQLEKINTEMMSMNELMRVKDSNLTDIEIELKNVRKQLEENKQMNETANALLIETQTIVKNKEEQIQNLREELSKTESIKNDLSTQLNTKTEQFELKDAKNASMLQSLNEEIMKLRAGIEKEKSKQENYQTLNDQLLGVKLELEAKLSNLNEEKRALIERCINSEEECKKLKNEVFQMRHKLDDSIAALHELGRENQSLQIEQTKFVNRRWADDNEAIDCAKCRKAFTVTNRKHHCRNCGQIFCNECSSKSAVMPLHPKPVRVCDNCHYEMNKK